MATSTLDIIKQAFKKIGVLASDSTLSADDANDAKRMLNQMLDYWSIEGLMCYCFINDSYTLTSTKADYTIGDGGNIDTDRPNKIESATINNGTSDYLLEIVTNEQYQGIYDKTLSGTPTKLLYNPEYPLGKLYFWPTPDSAYTGTISSKTRLSQLSNLAEDIALPEGYEIAIIYNLAILLAPEYGKRIPPDVYKTALETKAAIKRINIVPTYLIQEISSVGSFDINTGSYI